MFSYQSVDLTFAILSFYYGMKMLKYTLNPKENGMERVPILLIAALFLYGGSWWITSYLTKLLHS